MEYILTPYARKMEPIAWWDNLFTNEELNWLQDKAKTAKGNAQVGDRAVGSVNESIRRSELEWVRSSPDTKWVFEKLAHVASSINTQFFGFNLTGFGEPIQLTNYNSERMGMYEWHQDFGGSISRKLTLVVQLTDPAEYEGGNLEVMTKMDTETVPKRRGLISAFPSWTLHRVSPVVRGTRQSLVVWISGPDFI